MGFACGIVGLPNVGKSTLFNALSATQQAEAANYPFCTIEPNVGVVPVRRPAHGRAGRASVKPKKVVPTTLQFVDIAGLVRGASKGEGLGNQFLANIREVDAIAHVVRCFEDENVVHVEGRIDPAGDIATIDTELGLKDLESVEKRLAARAEGDEGPRGQDREADVRAVHQAHEGAQRRHAGARASTLTDEERPLVTELQLLTVEEGHVRRQRRREAARRRAMAGKDPHVEALRKVADKEGAPVVVICAAVEAEISTLPKEEQPEFLASLGLDEPGLQQAWCAPATICSGSSPSSPPARPKCAPGPSRKGTKAPQAAGDHPHRLRARLHQGRDHLVGGPGQARLARPPAAPPPSCTSRARTT